jgi:chloride channel protein, CIC family
MLVRLLTKVLFTLRAMRLGSLGQRILSSALVGVVAGLGAVVLYICLQLGIRFILGQLTGFIPPAPGGEPPLFPYAASEIHHWLIILVPAMGGLISGWIVYTFAPEAEGHGTDAVIESFHHLVGHIRARVPLVKAIATVFTLGSGGSGGREGPVAQIGAGFGSFLASILHLPPRERRILMIAGMGAGVGAIFKSPLAGAIFAGEVLYREEEIEYESLIPATIAAIVAYSVFCLFFGWGPLFTTPNMTFTDPLRLIPYTFLGLGCAVMGFIYIKTFYGTRDFFRKLYIPNFLKPALGGLLVGIVGFFLPQTLALGYGYLQGALSGDISLTWQLLLAIAFGKIITTSCSIGSGGSGGVFGPSMVIGGTFGGALGILFHQLLPRVVINQQAFVVVGMAGFFAGVASTPISTIIMVSEMTGNYNLLVPSMWVCTISFLLLRRWSIYEKQHPNRISSPAHYGELAVDILQGLKVNDWMNHEAVSLPGFTRFKDILKIATESGHAHYPVHDQEGHLLGVIALRDIVRQLGKNNATAGLIAADLLEPDCITVLPQENLNQALRKMDNYHADLLPVVAEEGTSKLVGILTRSDIIHAYNESVGGGIPWSGRDDELNKDLAIDILVGAVMTVHYDWVTPHLPLNKLELKFQDTWHHGFPVKDEKDDFVGIVTLTDLKRAKERVKDEKRITGLTVADIMTRDVLTCSPDDPLPEALRKFGQLDIGRIPVVDPSTPKKLLGMLRRADIIRTYSKIALKSTSPGPKMLASIEESPNAQFMEVTVATGSYLVDRSLKEISLPQDCLFICIRRKGRTIIPHGTTIFEPNDRIIAIATGGAIKYVHDLCHKPSP